MTKSINGRRILLAAGFGALAGLSAVLPATAQSDYPNKPITFVVPFPPGGATDTAARLVAPELEKFLGQPVLIENLPGASGAIGTANVAKRAPDGYTILLGSQAAASFLPNILEDAGYTFDDIEPVALFYSQTPIFSVRPDLPASSFPELIELAKSRPGELTYSHSGNLGPMHLSFELFKQLTGVDIKAVAYPGEAPAMQDVLGGHIDISTATWASSGPQIEAGTLKPIGQLGAERSPAMADIPTAVEQGVEDLVVQLWVAIFVPAGTPDGIQQRLNEAFAHAVSVPEVRDQLISKDQNPMGGSIQEVIDYIAVERPRWQSLVESLNVETN